VICGTKAANAIEEGEVNSIDQETNELDKNVWLADLKLEKTLTKGVVM